MIADCSPNAKAAMLHGLLTGYIVETDDDSDLPCHIMFDFQTCLPDCYPKAADLRGWCDAWIESKITETEFAELIAHFLNSTHSRCENHHPCQSDD